MGPGANRAFRRALAPALLALGIFLQIASSAAAAPNTVDRALHPGCWHALQAGDPAVYCGGRARVALKARGLRPHATAHVARLAGTHALRPGRQVKLLGKLSSPKAQLALVYRVGDRYVYVRFSGFGRRGLRGAVVTSRRRGSRLVVRMRAGGRSIAPRRKRAYAARTLPHGSSPVPAPPPLPAAGDLPETTSGVPCGPRPSAIPQSDDTLDSLWTVCGPGWTGGDGAYSATLPDGRRVWAFGDTFLGRVNDDGSRPADSPMVRNSLVVQDGTRLTTLHGGTNAQPASLVSPSDSASWYWAGTPVVEGSTLYWFLSRWSPTGDGSWDFSYQDSAVATFSLPDLTLQSVTTVPGGASVLWGAAVLDDGPYTYVYGTENSGGHRYAHVARAPRGALTGGWEYYTGSGWSADPAASARTLDGVSDAYSVIVQGGTYYLVAQQPDFGREIRAYPGPTPAGPWGPPSTLYTTPDPGPGRYTYSALVHPELSDASTLSISYDVNATDRSTLFADVWSYRPRFVRVPVTALAGG